MNGEFGHEGIPEDIPVTFHDRPGFHGWIAELACRLMIRGVGPGPFHIHGTENGQARRRKLSGEAGIDMEGVAGALVSDAGRIADIQRVGPCPGLCGQEDRLQKAFLPRQNVGLNKIKGVGGGECPGPGGPPGVLRPFESGLLLGDNALGSRLKNGLLASLLELLVRIRSLDYSVNPCRLPLIVLFMPE